VLLQHKADIDNVSDKNKDTALSLACSNGRLEVKHSIFGIYFCALCCSTFHYHTAFQKISSSQ